MKITTDICKQLICSQPEVRTGPDYIGNEPGLDLPKNWRRHRKSSLGRVVEECGELFEIDDLGVDGWTLLSSKQPKDFEMDCVVRHFVPKDGDSIDAMVISDPKDENILAIGWHRD
jgi:hypothetical protein